MESHTAPVVAASTLPLPAVVLAGGRPAPEDLFRGLDLVRSCGASHVDLTDSWLPLATLKEHDVDELRLALDRTGLAPSGVSVVRRSILDPNDARANLDNARRAIALAAALGAPVVSIGFHEALPTRAQAVPFWAFETRLPQRDDPVERVRDLADGAALQGVSIALELYEGGPLGSGSLAVDLVKRIGRPNVGINLDVGNLYRSPFGLGESWLDCVLTCLPYTNYWHVKNYQRIYEHPTGRMVGSIATSLRDGDIDYRRCMTEAKSVGYRGPIVVEHYGGDGIGMQRTGVAYLHELLERGHS